MKKITIKNFDKSQILNIGENENYYILLEDYKDKNRDFKILVNLIGKNSNLTFIGKVFANKFKKKNFFIKINIFGENQKINLNLKGIANNSSLISFNGIGLIGSKSKNAGVNIKERIILFDKKSTGRALPVLRAESNNLGDISHSAIVAPIYEEELFYFESRGINQNKAKELIKLEFLK